jgi:heme/copper-type cytochrome/quinol oxidase subunit 2
MLVMLGAVALSLFAPLAAAQSPEADREWALFNQILIIGIVVGVVVFGLMFYAIIRYREAPRKGGTN